jgi:hypothetical protein
MAITLGDISFTGMSGTLQRPKPVFEKYTRLGDKQVYMQRLRSESQDSQIEAWVIFDTYEACRAHERALSANVGIPLVFTFHEELPIFGVFVTDYTYTIKAGAKSKFLLRYNLTIVCDEISGVEG